ncbi:MAG TPA: non-ribosomal peptide synthetase, partial [Puia sp.]|nr:non-ribosomal peptide synthetase [Puia sp.]
PIQTGNLLDWSASGKCSASIYNSYGPTECTDVVTCYQIRENDLQTGRPIPIGTVVPNTRLFILDDQLNLLPAGNPGHIYIGGAGVGRGYLNREALTKERFIDHPFEEGARIYRTGDLGRWTEDGIIEFIGRTDDQVKIRGYRIEPGEIEKTICAHPFVSKAVVRATAINKENSLIAYIIRSGVGEIADLRKFLKERLPGYMLPDHILEIEEFPITSHGKIDHNRLPLPSDETLLSDKKEYVRPATSLQLGLAAIWTELTGNTQLGITDDFFEIGGNSIRATQAVSEIYRRFNITLRVSSIYLHSTIRELAMELELISWKSGGFLDNKEDTKEITDTEEIIL